MSRFPCGDTTRRRQAATTLGAKPRQPSRQRRVQRRSPDRGGAAQRLITRMPIKPYDTEKANLVTPLASPLGEEGHEVAKGWTVVRMLMVFLFYVLSPPIMCSLCIASIGAAADWRSGPRWSILSVLCPVHPFPLRGTSPQGETRDMREKQRVIYFTYHFGVFPLWWLSPPPCPVGGMSYDTESKSVTLTL